MTRKATGFLHNDQVAKLRHLPPGSPFAAGCNTDMVDVERLEDEQEAARVHELVARHAVLTGSPVAESILRDWASMRDRFVAVIPRDIKRIREAAALARAEPRSPAFGHLVGA